MTTASAEAAKIDSNQKWGAIAAGAFLADGAAHMAYHAFQGADLSFAAEMGAKATLMAPFELGGVAMVGGFFGLCGGVMGYVTSHLISGPLNMCGIKTGNFNYICGYTVGVIGGGLMCYGFSLDDNTPYQQERQMLEGHLQEKHARQAAEMTSPTNQIHWNDAIKQSPAPVF